MFKKSKTVLKHSKQNPAYPSVAPSKNFVPEWFRKTERFNKKGKIKELPVDMSFKACTVYGDTFLTGYTIPLPVDIAVRREDGKVIVTWNNPNEQYLSVREHKGHPNESIPVPLGCSPWHFIWITQHLIKIPKGYSALITHPLNRYDLPFISLSGIIDGEMTLHKGNIPVFFSETFEGIIPAGTPILQVIPFKQEDWTSEEDDSIKKEALLNQEENVIVAYGWYRDKKWRKKNFN
jgi:hypothetical protein